MQINALHRPAWKITGFRFAIFEVYVALFHRRRFRAAVVGNNTRSLLALQAHHVLT